MPHWDTHLGYTFGINIWDTHRTALAFYGGQRHQQKRAAGALQELRTDAADEARVAHVAFLVIDLATKSLGWVSPNQRLSSHTTSIE